MMPPCLPLSNAACAAIFSWKIFSLERPQSFFSSATSRAGGREDRMTGNVGKTRTTEEESLVEVRRKDAKMLDFRRISVFRGLSERRVRHVGEQTP